ncbi:MAG: cardiolipin synthase [Nocardioidaceae bacterium]
MTDAAIWSIVLTGLVACGVVGVMAVLVLDDRDPSIVLAWLLLILVVPVLGVLAYALIGRNYRRAARRRDGEAALGPLLPAPPATTGPAERVQRLGEAEGRTAPVTADSIRLYFTGAEKFDDLLADLRAAEHHVDLMYLIWECDELTARVTEVLQERLAAGVHVRVLYDWLSSAPYRKRELKALARAGAAVRPCYRRLRQLNYRNHMKMVLVDHAVVYSGGMNMGQEYIDGGQRFATWRDTHFRMTGPVVAEYAALFDNTWARSGPADHVRGERAAPPVVDVPSSTATRVQVLHSSVATSSPTIRDAFIAALTSAHDRVWIQSPYFVPDEPLITAMCVAAASGVEVRLMMTGHPDKKLPFHAAHAYFPTVLRAGVQVLLYDAGFLHAKTVTVDDELVVVGTCNWDIRSLLLHDEVVAVIYDQATVKRFADQFEADLQHSQAVTLADTQGLSHWQTGRDSLCRLTSRLL